MTRVEDRYAPLTTEERVGDSLEAGLDHSSQGSDDGAEIVLPRPPGAPLHSMEHPVLGDCSGSWPYRDASGGFIGYVLRFDPPKKQKVYLPQTLWRTSDGTLEWRWKMWPAPRPLLNQHAPASQPQALVLVVEGEKTAQKAAKDFPEMVVTTSPGGAHSAAYADWSPLAGRHIVIWPDNDEAGMGYAVEVTRQLYKIGVLSVRVVDLAGLPQKWDLADQLPEGLNPADRIANATLAEPSSESTAIVSGSEVEWPSGYRMTEEGLVREGQDRDEWVSGPFEVLGEARDAASEGWGLYVAWRDPDGRAHEAPVPRGSLIGDRFEFLATLSNGGFAAPVTPAGMRALRSVLSQLKCSARVRLVDKTGWHGTTFVLPFQSYGVGAEPVRFRGVSDVAMYRQTGSLADWIEQVASPAQGNTRLIFALSVAFSGPVIDLLEEESGGFHFVGGSSVGKSTALLLAGSVWGGGGRLGFAQTWRATSNGLEGLAKAHSGTCLILDELGELDPKEANQVAYFLANGQGKARAGREGNAKPRADWRCSILSSGEKNLSDLIEEDGRRARQGQKIRFLDIPADAGARMGLFEQARGHSPSKFSEVLRNAALTYYGTAGPTFVQALSSHHDESRRRLSREIDALVREWVPPNADHQVQRAARRFATVGVSGTLAARYLGLPWNDGEAEASAYAAFEAWRNRRGSDGPGELTAAVEALVETIQRSGKTGFTDLGTQNEAIRQPVSQKHLGYYKLIEGEGVWLFSRESMEAILRPVGDFQTTVALLHENDFLLVTPSESTRRQYYMRVGAVHKRFYAVKDSALTAGSPTRPE